MAGRGFDCGSWDVEESAPGRVNLIGEHTDYNDGWVLPMPIPQRTRVRSRKLGAREVRVSSSMEETTSSWPLGAEQRTGKWTDYVMGCFAVGREAGFEVTSGVSLAVSSEVPVGAGLSSSAALEVAVLRALRATFGWPLGDVELALLAQRAEVEFVGARVGPMDQLASSCGVDGEAVLVDCRDLFMRAVVLPGSCEIAVIDSGIRHFNAGGGYDARRDECEAACRLLGVASLRDVQEQQDLPALPEPLHRRVRHVVEENARVLEMVQALTKEDLEAAGAIVNASHASLRDCYEVTVPGVDALAAAATEQAGVYGARMTGGGFGGSVMLLCERGAGGAAARATVEACSGTLGGATAEVVLPLAPPADRRAGRAPARARD